MTVKELIALLQHSHAPKAEVEFIMPLGGLDFTLIPTKRTSYITGDPPKVRIHVKPKNRTR